MPHEDVVEILLVEDSEDDLELTLRALRSSKIANHVRIARDGVEALDYLFAEQKGSRPASRPPRVILLDLKLPRIDGLEVLRRVKSDPATQGIPVVVLTSSAEQRDVVESYRLGVNSYIVKPVNFEGFSRAIQEIGLYWMLLNRTPAAETGP